MKTAILALGFTAGVFSGALTSGYTLRISDSHADYVVGLEDRVFSAIPENFTLISCRHLANLRACEIRG